MSERTKELWYPNFENNLIITPKLEKEGYLDDLRKPIEIYMKEIENCIQYLNFLEYNSQLEFSKDVECFSKMNKWSKKKRVKAKILYQKFHKLLISYYAIYSDMMAKRSNNSQNDISKSEEDLPEELIGFSRYLKAMIDNVYIRNPHITFKLSDRTKAWRRFIEKSITLIEDDYSNWDSLENFEEMNNFKFDRFYDIYAGKITVQSEPIKSIKKNIDYERGIQDCYDIMNSFLTVVEESGATFLPQTNIGETSDKIIAKYRKYVKDYIANPKPNDYQALHSSISIDVYIHQEINGRKVRIKKKVTFELQVQTKLMELHCKDGGICGHDEHKKRTKLALNVDYSKITGYTQFCADILPNGSIVIDDDIGLEEGLEITPRRYYQATLKRPAD